MAYFFIVLLMLKTNLKRSLIKTISLILTAMFLLYLNSHAFTKILKFNFGAK